MQRRAVRSLTVLCAITALGGTPSALRAQDEPAAPPKPLVTLASVTVAGPSGGALGPETLARLTVEITNGGERIASAFAFTVSVAGHELPVYRDQVFLKPVPAGKTVELPLYNFWTGETGRPAPADGKLRVEVTLREARWMEVSEEEGVEVWTPVGPVEGLPVSAATVVELAKGS